MDSDTYVDKEHCIYYDFWNRGRDQVRLRFSLLLRPNFFMIAAWSEDLREPNFDSRCIWSKVGCIKPVIEELSKAFHSDERHIEVLNVAMRYGLESYWVRDFLLGDF